MARTNFELIRKHVYTSLKALSPNLVYHKLDHTRDVLKQTEKIALREKVSEHDLYLLKVAALYHDTGFLQLYVGHEEVSCHIFLRDAEKFGFTKAEQEKIVGMIRATHVPQQPKNHLENILCDADLDYLGRHDFAAHSELLKKEFLYFGLVENEEQWLIKQQEFLLNHEFHTETSKLLRSPMKKQNMALKHSA